MPVPKAEVLELMRMDADPAELDEIRELWKEHSKAEDNRSIEGLLATLSEDCVYTVYPDDVSWHGHEGAARFYTELLTAFPDIVFELQNIVIGPQGVVEEAIVTGTHRAKWLDNEPTGETMTWRNAIFFPWDPVSRRFKGERVYTDMPRRAAWHMRSARSTSSATDPASARSAGRSESRPSASTASSTRPATPGIHHYHDTQDELYFVHSGTAKVEVEGEERILGPGGLFHVESTTPRRISNAGDEELVLLVIGGKDGYVERDGHVDERRGPRASGMSLGKEQA